MVGCLKGKNGGELNHRERPKKGAKKTGYKQRNGSWKLDVFQSNIGLQQAVSIPHQTTNCTDYDLLDPVQKMTGDHIVNGDPN